MGAQPILSWSLMKQSLRNRFGVRNHEEQRQSQAKGKIIESSMGEKPTKASKLSQAQDILDRKVIHHEKKSTCTFVKEEKSREEKVKSVVSTKESEGKRKESEYLIENNESLKEEKVKEKKDEIEKSEETKEEISLMIFERDKREEMKGSCRDINSSLNSLSTEEMNLFTNSNNHFLDCFSELSFQGCQGVQIWCNGWIIPKRAFVEKSFHGFTSFSKKSIKDLSTIARSLIDVTKKMLGFTWETCSPHLEFDCNKAYYPTTLLSSFEVDYCANLLMPFDLIPLFPLFIDHVLRFGDVQKLEYFKYIYFKNHDVLATNNKKFGIKSLVFDPGSLGWDFLRFG
ncbi:hypothetical protein M9H77_03317 [Catharanthus roseus]|uniref:Uncharacterized protein n=1 Tax=Catharanthus roseus TaxID=4058 RepID=A0ACC0CB28_CATRO|nr:hypothetical protein M9H77_03317 [Catharanthus roseus]